jgi:UDP-2,3-diacylglucosamine hydrolase
LSDCGVQALSDPCLLRWGDQRILLSHGDALCLDDREYQSFRQLVRQVDWQSEFLAKPLHERLSLARAMRTQSESQKHSATVYADADLAMALNWLRTSGADRLVHGHTHQPADHALGKGCRHVLSDWSLDHAPTRAQVFRLQCDGAITRIDAAGASA